jgi:hypothetical protein
VSDWDLGEICADTQTGDVAAGQRDVQGEQSVTQFQTVAFHKEERCSCASYLLSAERLRYLTIEVEHHRELLTLCTDSSLSGSLALTVHSAYGDWAAGWFSDIFC